MLIVMYLAAIVAANFSVAYFGPASTIVNAFLFIGLDITTRDTLHEKWAHNRLWLRMFGLIATGSLLSLVLDYKVMNIALASCVALLLSSLADTVVYSLLHDKAKFVKINGSNVVSAAVDSIVFPTIAFGGFIWWVVLGQFVAKTLGGAVWAWFLTRKER